MGSTVQTQTLKLSFPPVSTMTLKGSMPQAPAPPRASLHPFLPCITCVCSTSSGMASSSLASEGSRPSSSSVAPGGGSYRLLPRTWKEKVRSFLRDCSTRRRKGVSQAKGFDTHSDVADKPTTDRHAGHAAGAAAHSAHQPAILQSRLSAASPTLTWVSSPVASECARRAGAPLSKPSLPLHVVELLGLGAWSVGWQRVMR